MNAVSAQRPLDDVLLAMDVVDTLRHRDATLSRELDVAGREAQLIDRLREIYTAQGIAVPDHVLREGVKALAEHRFLYVPPKPSFAVRLAKIYVTRDRWLKPVIGGAVAVLAAFGVYQVGVVGPAKHKAERAAIELTTTLPADLVAALETVRASTQDAEALRLAETFYQDGVLAIDRKAPDDARKAAAALRQLRTDVAVTYDVRVVFGPGEARSGIFRIPDDAPMTRNYYLIVEAADPAGRLVSVPVTSEETGKSERVSRWAQRVSEPAFSAVAADKSDDQIIQRAVIGTKQSGQLRPSYAVETPGGALLEW